MGDWFRRDFNPRVDGDGEASFEHVNEETLSSVFVSGRWWQEEGGMVVSISLGFLWWLDDENGSKWARTGSRVPMVQPLRESI
jgi:drug/metabolite transporter superfamily protein YnfA